MTTKTLIRGSENFTKKDMINGRNGVALQDYIIQNPHFIVVKAAQVKSEDEKETKFVAVLVLEDGTVITSISSSIFETTGDIIDLLDEEHAGQSCYVESRTSKGNRDFLTMRVE